MLESPNLPITGIFKPFILSAICPKVSDPKSPNFSASGASPIPTESITVKNTLLKRMVLPPAFISISCK